MKLYERIENNNFNEIDKNRAIELIENGNGHLIYIESKKSFTRTTRRGDNHE